MKDLFEQRVRELREAEKRFGKVSNVLTKSDVLRKKSVLKPNAQNNSQQNQSKNTNFNYETINTALNKTKNNNRLLHYIIRLTYIQGLRISEVLNINYNNITNEGEVLILGLKGSDNKIIYDSYTAEYLKKCKRIKFNPFETINRYTVYRDFIKLNLIYKSSSSSKNSVTHSLRHMKAKELRSSGIPEEEIKRFLGHKNIRNTNRYGH